MKGGRERSGVEGSGLKIGREPANLVNDGDGLKSEREKEENTQGSERREEENDRLFSVLNLDFVLDKNI